MGPAERTAAVAILQHGDYLGKAVDSILGSDKGQLGLQENQPHLRFSSIANYHCALEPSCQLVST